MQQQPVIAGQGTGQEVRMMSVRGAAELARLGCDPFRLIGKGSDLGATWTEAEEGLGIFRNDLIFCTKLFSQSTLAAPRIQAAAGPKGGWK
jgi:hypothetical protein